MRHGGAVSARRPTTSYGRPSRSPARSTSPRARCSRIRVADTTSPPTDTIPSSTPSRPVTDTRRRSVPMSPAPPRPNRKFSPTTTRRTPMRSRRTSRAKSSAARPEHRRVGGEQHDERGSGVAEQPQPVGEAGQRRRHPAVAEVGVGMALEGDGTSGQAHATAGRERAVQQGAVAAVHAVELAEGDDRGTEQLAHSLRSSEHPETIRRPHVAVPNRCVSSRRNPTLSVTW